jgi:XTP/dITP diphosphohydrolase
LATRNAGKVREFGRLLGPRLNVELLPPQVRLPKETGRTFAANARLKAESAAKALGWAVAVLADDSGLEVKALGGRPGVCSARFAGDDAGDEDNVTKLLGELGDSDDRAARFVCALCLALPGGPGAVASGGLVEVEGVVVGDVTTAPRGNDGFGYDPVFQPETWSTTLAEAAPQAKDSVSHRGAACRRLIARLAEAGMVDAEAG